MTRNLVYYTTFEKKRLTEVQKLAQGIPQNPLAVICGYITHSLLPFPLKVPLSFDDDHSICIHVASLVSWT